MRSHEIRDAFPFFQPIIRRDDESVFAYEVLGRVKREGRIKSLGPFFENPQIADAEKLEIDGLIREKAFAAYAELRPSAKLFVNIKPSWILNAPAARPEESVLHLIDKYKIEAENIVVEVTEEELLGDMEVFSRLVTQYRRAGCLLAIDDFGKGASSIERIAYLMPDILKIDRSIVQRLDLQRSFFDVSNAMSSFGSFSGFDILFEGIETPYELEACVEARGRFYQGYIFSQARPVMDGHFDNQKLLSDMLSLQGMYTQNILKRRNKIIKQLKALVQNNIHILPKTPQNFADPDALLAFTALLPHYCVQCFICDAKGREISWCYSLLPDGSTALHDRRTTCWFYNDFFLNGLYELQGEHICCLSRSYKSVATKGDLATYMQLLPGGNYLCIDIMSLSNEL